MLVCWQPYSLEVKHTACCIYYIQYCTIKKGQFYTEIWLIYKYLHSHGIRLQWSIKNWQIFFKMLNDILWLDHIQWQPPTDQTLYRTRPFTEFWVVSIEHLRRVWHADRGRLLLRTPGPVPLGLAYVRLVETNPFSELVVIFPDYALRISLGTFSILLLMKATGHVTENWFFFRLLRGFSLL